MTVFEQPKPKNQSIIIQSDGVFDSWQSILANAITDPQQLLSLLNLEQHQIEDGLALNPNFPLRVPSTFLKKMQPNNPKDPLLLQILPSNTEFKSTPGFNNDPLEESEFTPVPGLLHKYHGRALLITSPACVVNCRYCFRRHFPYQEHRGGPDQLNNALEYLRSTKSVNEIILSGGDPLALNNQRLGNLISQLESIPHLQTLRIHTRFPVMVPQRIDGGLIQILTSSRLKKVIVLHVNHPNEIDNTLYQHIQPLYAIQATILNQSVLLRGVNDNINTLVRLSKKLFEFNILPYYLHFLDPVSGTAHFFVENDKAINLEREMRAQLPGYLVPKLVQELPFARSKLPMEATKED